jgi:hypothetical protein
MLRLIRITATSALAFAALSVPAVAQDLRSADARDAASHAASVRQLGAYSPATGRDLRSPDARDAAREVVSTPEVDKLSTAVRSDLRSPDARDAAKNVVITYEPGKVSTPSEQVSQLPSNGFDWGDAGIGAAGMLALVAVASGTLLIVGHRRRGRRLPVTTS